MTIQVCELQTAWEEGLTGLRERLHWLLSLTGCCDATDAKQRLSPARQEEVDRLETQINTYQGDPIYRTLYCELLDKTTAREIFPSQQAKSSTGPLTSTELRVAILWHKLLLAGINDVTDSRYEHERMCADAWFTAHEEHYNEIARVLVLDSSRECLELEVLEAAVSLLVEQPHLQPGIAVAAAEERIQERGRGQLVIGKGIVDIGNVELDSTTIRACAVLAMYRHFGCLFDALGRVTADAIAGTTNLDERTVHEIRDYAVELDRRWPPLVDVDTLVSNLFDDEFEAKFAVFIRAGHDFIGSLTPADVGAPALAQLRAEALRGLAAEIASGLTDRASATVELVARSLVGQIARARAILTRADVLCEYGQRDSKWVVATTTGLTVEQVEQAVMLGEHKGIVLSWVANAAKKIGDQNAQFLRVEDIVAGGASDDPFVNTSAADLARSIDALFALGIGAPQQDAAQPVTLLVQATQPTDVNGDGDTVEVTLGPVMESGPAGGVSAPPPMPARVKLQASMFPSSPVAAGG